jgi:hypothetical protein
MSSFLPPPCLHFQLTTLDKKHVWRVSRPPLLLGFRSLSSGKAADADCLDHYWQLIPNGDTSKFKLQHGQSEFVVEAPRPKSKFQFRLIGRKHDEGEESDVQWLLIDTEGDARNEFKIRFARTNALLCYQVFNEAEGILGWKILPVENQDGGSARKPFIDRFCFKIEDIALVTIEYHFDRAIRRATEPTDVGFSGTSNNQTGTPQQKTIEQTITRQNSSQWRNDFGLKFQATSTVNIGVPHYYQSTFSATGGIARNITWGASETSTSEHKVSVPLSMEPFKNYKVEIWVKEQTLLVPFTARWRIVRSQETFDTQGVYEGASWVDYETHFSEIS